MRLEINDTPTFVGTASRAPRPDAPSILMIHGAGMDHSVWTLPARYFARHGFNIIAPDLPGHGRSGGDAAATIESIAAFCTDLLNALAVKRCHVVGHSMGSLAALCLAGEGVIAIESLSLLGTSAPMPVTDVLIDTASSERVKAYQMANAWSHSQSGTFGANENPGYSNFNLGQRLMERCDEGVYAADLSACNSCARGMDYARACRAPALVVIGSDDKMTAPVRGASVAEALDNPQVVQLDGCGHAMLTEAPNAVLDALIARISPAT